MWQQQLAKLFFKPACHVWLTAAHTSGDDVGV